MGHEGSGSILSLLKSRNLANAIYAGAGDSGYEDSSSHCLFTFHVNMPEGAVERWEEICEVVFSYLDMLKGAGKEDGSELPPHIHSEIRDMAEFNFQFQEEEDPMDFVEELAEQIALQRNYIPPERILDGSSRIFSFEGDKVMSLLRECFTVENMRVDILSSKFGQAKDYDASSSSSNGGGVASEALLCDFASKLPSYLKVEDQEVEPAFGSRYWSCELSPSTVSKLKSPPSMPSLHLPAKNPFVPSDFSMKPFPPSDSLHPLLNSSCKMCDSESKTKAFFPCSIVKFSALTSSFLFSFEDGREEWYKSDLPASSAATADQAFTVGGGRFKVKVVQRSGQEFAADSSWEGDAASKEVRQCALILHTAPTSAFFCCWRPLIFFYFFCSQTLATLRT